eukprot:TRINITY_DN44193_c0_g1_i1.p1 TRINITY_DN44193_c0_g1~~TRINITY_DN44193_c0_g1_i1.p1  ORF type:complete len:629 (-),score=163.78 TRINITY_DN44193_c0_g1_i1:26-1912(-)
MAKLANEQGPNPFSLPPEMQCFWLQEPVPERSAEERLQERKLKVWEKPTCSSKYSAIRKVRDEELPMAPLPPALANALALSKGKVMEEERPDSTFLTTVATKPAVGLVDPLRKSEKDIRTYVEKKREVFLVHMACDNKREEIVRLDGVAKSKESALATSQQMLDEDTKAFEEYLQEKISGAEAIKKESEKHAKLKQDKLQKIKSLKQQIAGVQSETSKLKEVRVECEKYQEFLDKLTPNEWKQEQHKIKLERKRLRAETWRRDRLAGVFAQLDAEEDKLNEKAAAEDAEAEAQLKRRGKKSRQSLEEELAQKQRDREIKRKKIRKRRDEEERRVRAEYVEVSSEEEYELFFKEPSQLMDSFTDLEEVNLFLIQSSQETEQMLDVILNTFENTKKEMGSKVQTLKDNIAQLEQSIRQEKLRGEGLKKSQSEKASTVLQDKKLHHLASEVHKVYQKCDLARDQQQPDTLAMLGAIESRIEELIQGLEEAFHQDSDLVVSLEWRKERERRDRVRESRIKEQNDKQEERLKQSLQRSQKPVFKKAGKQVMYRSPPLRQERKVVKDTTDDEAHARDHKVFSIYIDRKTQVPQTEAPVIEEPRRGAAQGLSAGYATATTAALPAAPASPRGELL